jgi:hypothetical protein
MNATVHTDYCNCVFVFHFLIKRGATDWYALLEEKRSQAVVVNSQNHRQPKCQKNFYKNCLTIAPLPL